MFRPFRLRTGRAVGTLSHRNLLGRTGRGLFRNHAVTEAVGVWSRSIIVAWIKLPVSGRNASSARGLAPNVDIAVCSIPGREMGAKALRSAAHILERCLTPDRPAPCRPAPSTSWCAGKMSQGASRRSESCCRPLGVDRFAGTDRPTGYSGSGSTDNNQHPQGSKHQARRGRRVSAGAVRRTGRRRSRDRRMPATHRRTDASRWKLGASRRAASWTGD